MNRLAGTAIDERLQDEAVTNIAFTWVLTHDRTIDQIHGYQARKRTPARVLEQRAPWQTDMILGYSIHLILEWLRLEPRPRPEMRRHRPRLRIQPFRAGWYSRHLMPARTVRPVLPEAPQR
jgi:hypothetical protein